MDKTSGLERRERALEAQYFTHKDSELIDKLKLVFHKKIDKQSIREATGVTDEELLDGLVELNLDGELMAAFNLLPVIEVAWADGVVDDREVHAVLAAAEKQGIQPGGKAYAMLETRLREGPSKDARKLWFHYAETLRKTLNGTELDQFRKDLLEACRRVAEASGGLLNVAFTVSANEKKVMKAVAQALTI
jgi:hypothetical protein